MLKRGVYLKEGVPKRERKVMVTMTPGVCVDCGDGYRSLLPGDGGRNKRKPLEACLPLFSSHSRQKSQRWISEYVCEDCVEHYYCNAFDRLSQSAAECVFEGREREITKFWYLSWR